MKRVVVGLLGFLLASCSWTSTESINYAPYRAFSEMPNHLYLEHGAVGGVGRGWYTRMCETAVEEALADVLTRTGEMGGNAIARVRWITDDGKERTTPTCDGVFALYAWWAVARVGALAITIKEGDGTAAIRFNPELPARREASRIIASMNPPLTIAPQSRRLVRSDPY